MQLYVLCAWLNVFLSILCIAPPVIVPVGENAIAVNTEDNVLLQFEITRANPPVLRDNITWSFSTSSGQLGNALKCENTTK